MRGQFNFDTIRIDYYRDNTAMMEAFRKGLFDLQGDSDPIDAVKWAEAYDFPAARDGLVKKLCVRRGRARADVGAGFQYAPASVRG